MNCPSRTDEPEGTGMNQNPNALAADLTTREDLNGIANSRILRRSDASEVERLEENNDIGGSPDEKRTARTAVLNSSPSGSCSHSGGDSGGGKIHGVAQALVKAARVLKKFSRFIGPGMMIAVAYIDPGNYSTDVAAGASYQFQAALHCVDVQYLCLFLQSLCIKLGSVSGLNLAEACKHFLPWWLNIFLYIMAEAAIIATDIAEVIGTAIAINLLIPQIPLVAGCALSICDVLLILLFYHPNGSLRGLRIFECFVAALVLGVVICFCIQLSLIKDTSIGEVFRGYLPSSAIVQSQGLYQACGILGATVMPHSLYLGSGIVQPRLYDYDRTHGITPPIERTAENSTSSEKEIYYPSLPAIKYCMKMSIVELAICLFTFALFVNSSILITAGASLYEGPDSQVAEADLFGIYNLLSTNIAPAAGTIFALALLMSGISAGIVCTIAGQMVSEGALNWTLKPWLRDGLSAALNGSQVALSVVLPFVSAPLIYFTCRNKYMTVRPHQTSDQAEETILEGTESGGSGVKMRNHWLTATVMNVANSCSPRQG
ncbi:natural resistance-associated macrophage protein-domain-containing protein [Bisporella sp. PMI_857]|nr:natural resistance-associated macrophage protein-domain-containing protein [Bisporella sp. PMI_857]KAH8600487.1 natural resistance-associated macrophage protein-domain-containing protein [Bisporella sp. PMI_857]